MKKLLCLIVPAITLLAQAPDNSATNKRDREPGSATAGTQKNNKDDLHLAKEIRQAVYKDKSLSTYAHNVKIVVAEGKVTLRGPVKSEAEKSTVAEKAAAVAGANNVINELEVAADKK
ncbi:MAG TPA: BON domain-containing protein [Bryobacteraceae bacterium]|nr:BON domain-containing protein [Bryobacteraceae bacterium]